MNREESSRNRFFLKLFIENAFSMQIFSPGGLFVQGGQIVFTIPVDCFFLINSQIAAI